LAATLRGVYANRPDKTIRIATGAGVSYQNIIDSIDVAKSAGVVIVGIAPSGLGGAR
jgi:biopolymer transport protein ExbD